MMTSADCARPIRAGTATGPLCYKSIAKRASDSSGPLMTAGYRAVEAPTLRDAGYENEYSTGRNLQKIVPLAKGGFPSPNAAPDLGNRASDTGRYVKLPSRLAGA